MHFSMQLISRRCKYIQYFFIVSKNALKGNRLQKAAVVKGRFGKSTSVFTVDSPWINREIF